MLLVLPAFTRNCVPSNVTVDSPSNVFAVPEPVITLLSALLFIVVPVTVLKVESPARNVDEFAVPEPNLAVGTVPEAILEAFKLVKDAPEPLKVVEAVSYTHLTLPTSDLV